MTLRQEQALLEKFREAASIGPGDNAILLAEEAQTFQVWVKDPVGNIDEYRGFEPSPGVIEVFHLPPLDPYQQEVYDRILGLVHKAQDRSSLTTPIAIPVLNLADHMDVFHLPEAGQNLMDLVRPPYQLCVNRLCTELVCDGWLLEIVVDREIYIATIRPWRLQQAA